MTPPTDPQADEPPTRAASTIFLVLGCNGPRVFAREQDAAAYAQAEAATALGPLHLHDAQDTAELLG